MSMNVKVLFGEGERIWFCTLVFANLRMIFLHLD